MNDTPPAEDAGEFPGRKAVVCLGGALLAALFLVLVLAWRDNGRRAELETTAELTAVGDAHYFPMPAPPPPPPYPAVASFRGQPLYPVDYHPREYHADDMNRLGVDEMGGYFIYEAQRPRDEGEANAAPAYFLRISPTEYLQTRPGTANAK